MVVFKTLQKSNQPRFVSCQTRINWAWLHPQLGVESARRRSAWSGIFRTKAMSFLGGGEKTFDQNLKNTQNGILSRNTFLKTFDGPGKQHRIV